VSRWLRGAVALIAIVALGLTQATYATAFPTTDQVVISNNGAILAGSVSTFPAGTSANGAPAFHITGTATGLGGVGAAPGTSAAGGTTGAAISPFNLHTYVANQLTPGSLRYVTAPVTCISPGGVLIDPLPGGCVPFGFTSTGSVVGFAPGDTGNSAPEVVIKGQSTGLSFPAGVAFGADGRLYVANELPGPGGASFVIGSFSGGFGGFACAAFGGITLGTITVYDPDANGDVLPIFDDPVFVFDPLAAPFGLAIRIQHSSIGGCKSFLLGPVGIAVDNDDRIWVVNQFGPFINVFDPDLTGFGDVFPVGAFIGAGLGSPRYIALGDGGGGGLPEVYVTDARTTSLSATTCLPVTKGDNSVNFFAPFVTGGGIPFAISASFDGEIKGKKTKLSIPQGIAANADDTLFVANTNGNSFALFPEGFIGNVRPFSLIRGPHTKMNQPVGIALTPDAAD